MSKDVSKYVSEKLVCIIPRPAITSSSGTYGFHFRHSLVYAVIGAEFDTIDLQTGSFYYLVRYALNRLDHENDKEGATRRTAAAAILRRLDPQDQDEKSNGDGQRLQRSRKEDLVLNQYEAMIAMDVVAPDDIPVAFEGGFTAIWIWWRI